MAERGNKRRAYQSDVAYLTVRNSTWLQAMWRGLDSAFQSSWQSIMADLATNITIDEPADDTALETAPSYTTADFTEITASRKLIRATARLNKMTLRESGAGMVAQERLNTLLGLEMAKRLDTKIAQAVAALSYDSVDGSGNDNSITTGTAGADFLSRSFPYRATSSTGNDTLEMIAQGLADSHMLLTAKEAIGRVEVVGVGSGGELMAIYPIGVARALADYLLQQGVLQQRSDIAAMAGADRGINSMTEYAGTWGGVANIIGSTSLATPTGNAHWQGYIFASNGPLAAAVTEPAISDADYDAGNTGGRYVTERTGISRYAVMAIRPAHIVRHTILAA